MILLLNINNKYKILWYIYVNSSDFNNNDMLFNKLNPVIFLMVKIKLIIIIIIKIKTILVNMK